MLEQGAAMATISSVGLGSGIDVNSIVTQLVAIEKMPITALAIKATKIGNQVSALSQIKAQFAALGDVATRISSTGAWSARTAVSSNPSAATITATGVAVASKFTLDVDALASQQVTASAGLAVGFKPGAGTLQVQLGAWSAAGSHFTAGAADAVPVTIGAADGLSVIASKINSAKAGVVASVFNDGVNDRLVLTSKLTGAASGFRIQSDDAALASLVFDPELSPSKGMAASNVAAQYGQDAKARINGIPVTSSTNTLSSNMTGVSISLLATTTVGYGTGAAIKAPLVMSISEDVTPAVRNITDFVTAFNALSKNLADLTKYDAANKSAALFQGDSGIAGLQAVLRSMAGSSSLGATSQRLSDIGIERQLDGSLSISTAKLSVSANNGTQLQQLFTQDNNDPASNGFALKFKDLSSGVLSTRGSISTRLTAFNNELVRNTVSQTKVTAQATLFEARLRKQYSALDSQMANLNALNAYVTQQVTTWNKSTA
jgi:flagellar hook-associated protein 2